MNVSKISQVRDIVITGCAIAALVIFGYEKLNPKVESDRIETTAVALLKAQPAGLTKVAAQIEAGAIGQDEESVAKALKAAHKSAADDHAAALKAENYSASALRRAATAMSKGLR